MNASPPHPHKAQLVVLPAFLRTTIGFDSRFARHRLINGTWIALILSGLVLASAQTPAPEHGDRLQKNENEQVHASPSEAGSRTDYLRSVAFGGSWKGRLNFYPDNAPNTQSPCVIAISPDEKIAALYSEQMPEGRNPAPADRQGPVLRWIQRLPSGATASFTMELVAEGYAVVDIVSRWEKGKRASLPPVVGSGNFVKQ